MKNNWIFTNIILLFSLVNYAQPNILVIVADDLGIDAMNGYNIGSTSLPVTPNLDALRTQGLLFNNAWVNPVCSPTRAAILSGQYGSKTGVTGVPGELALSYETLFEKITTQTNGTYANAVFGKWHLGGNDNDNPNMQGVQHFAGVTGGAVQDYNSWNYNLNGTVTTTTEYATTKFTNDAIAWIDQQTQPWFVWMAHVAPHSPFHVPPDPNTYSQTNTNGNRRKFLAAIEALDYEIGRLYDSLTETEKANTLIIFIGDNGSPGQVVRTFPDGHQKGSLYEGGIRVPMFAVGNGVSRVGEVEDGMVHGIDIHATILDVIDNNFSSEVDNSRSFKAVLSDANATTNPYNFSENDDGKAIRNAQYKLIDYNNGTQEFYDLINDPLETTELLVGGLTTAQTAILTELEAEANQRATAWSCNDLIQNGDEEDIDCGGSSCANCMVLAIDELAYFTATNRGQQVQLEWALANTNTAQTLHVERSPDNENWTTLATLTDEASRTQQVIDPVPLAENYYRLKRVSETGNIDYSAVRHVILNAATTRTLEFYPNPSNDFFTIKNWKQAGEVYLYNAAGQLVQQVALPAREEAINLVDLAAGIYFVEVMDIDGERYFGRIVRE
ncbi:MAG: sulfatase-like hydrolase/transferase [Saprospiraceae bacterium]